MWSIGLKNDNARRGMTLIELIFVMALLATIFAMAAPKLSMFVSGRSLTEESRRFVGLTRFARSEAISRSVPMELWISPDEGLYGLRPTIEYESKAPVEFMLARGLTFNVADAPLDEYGHATMLYLPDGSIDTTSIERVTIQQEDKRALAIVKTDMGFGYKVESVANADIERP